MSQTLIQLGAAYEIARWRSDGSGSIKDANVFERSTAIDLLVRGRYWHDDISLVSRNRAIARSGDLDLVDPLVGLRVRYQWAPGRELVPRSMWVASTPGADSHGMCLAPTASPLAFATASPTRCWGAGLERGL